MAMQPSPPDLTAAQPQLQVPPRSPQLQRGQMGPCTGSVPVTQQYMWTLPWHMSVKMQYQSPGKCLRYLFLCS